MDQIIYFLRSHRRQILRLGRKNQGGQGGGVGGFGGGMSGPQGGYGGMPPGAQGGYGGMPPGAQGGYADAPGGPAPNTQQVLGSGNIHAFDDNNVNAQNAQYQDLRNRARHEGDLMSKAFNASKQAYQHGNAAQAKQLSDEGNMHKQQMEQLNAQAVQWIFAANNADSPQGTVDLHGLYVKEAIAKVDEVVRQAQAQHYPQLRLIVGKGIHSKDHVSHIRPAVEDLLRKYNIAAHIDRRNQGVVVVDMNGPPGGGSADFTHTIARNATGDDKEVRGTTHQCIIM